MESMGRNDQTVLSEGRAWATCSGYRDDATDVSDADMVQPVHGDSGYLGVPKQEDVIKDEHLSQIDYRICKRPSSLKTSKDYEGINWEKQMENRISSIRCKVEHAFLIVKRDFGYRKVAYRGIAKNMNRFHVLFGCANLLMCIRTGRTEQFRNKQVAPIAG